MVDPCNSTYIQHAYSDSDGVIKWYSLNRVLVEYTSTEIQRSPFKCTSISLGDDKTSFPYVVNIECDWVHILLIVILKMSFISAFFCFFILYHKCFIYQSLQFFTTILRLILLYFNFYSLSVCLTGTFGRNCSEVCNCLHGSTCNVTTGNCYGGCAPGWRGDDCTEGRVHVFMAITIVFSWRNLCKWLIDWLIIYCFTLKNISFTWMRHYYRWRAAKFRPMLGAQGLWAGRHLYSVTPALTRGLSFPDLIRRTAPFSRLLRHTRGCGGSILTWILTTSPSTWPVCVLTWDNGNVWLLCNAMHYFLSNEMPPMAKIQKSDYFRNTSRNYKSEK
jgi:hypothetical protein